MLWHRLARHTYKREDNINTDLSYILLRGYKYRHNTQGNVQPWADKAPELLGCDGKGTVAPALIKHNTMKYVGMEV
jgi:hypothetical protein